jgi:hypothetical protein
VAVWIWIWLRRRISSSNDISLGESLLVEPELDLQRMRQDSPFCSSAVVRCVVEFLL